MLFYFRPNCGPYRPIAVGTTIKKLIYVLQCLYGADTQCAWLLQSFVGSRFPVEPAPTTTKKEYTPSLILDTTIFELKVSRQSLDVRLCKKFTRILPIDEDIANQYCQLTRILPIDEYIANWRGYCQLMRIWPLANW